MESASSISGIAFSIFWSVDRLSRSMRIGPAYPRARAYFSMTSASGTGPDTAPPHSTSTSAAAEACAVPATAEAHAMPETPGVCAAPETVEACAKPETEASAKARPLPEANAAPELCRTGLRGTADSQRVASPRWKPAPRSPSNSSERSLARCRPAASSERSPARTRYRLTKFARAPRFAKPSTTTATRTSAALPVSIAPASASPTSALRAELRSTPIPLPRTRLRTRLLPHSCAFSPRPKLCLLARQ